MQPGDRIVQRIPLLPALPRLVQTVAVIRVCEVLNEPFRRGFMVATTDEHEEIAAHTLWLERCSETQALLLHSRGVSRWADHVPRWLWFYTRARYRQGHLALRRHLLKRARKVQATRGATSPPAPQHFQGCFCERRVCLQGSARKTARTLCRIPC